MKVMTGLPKLSDDLGAAFLIGNLLSGSLEASEEALLSGIDVVALDENFREAILLWVVRSVFARSTVSDREAGEGKAGNKYLPTGLIRVSQLPAAMRYCFVLRVLLGRSVEECATLLGADSEWMNEQLSAAYEFLSETISCG